MNGDLCSFTRREIRDDGRAPHPTFERKSISSVLIRFFWSGSVIDMQVVPLPS